MERRELEDYIFLYLTTKNCNSKDGGCVNSNICQEINKCCSPAGISFFVFPDESITDGWLEKYKKQHPNGIYDPSLTLDNYKKVLQDGYKIILRSLYDMTNEEHWVLTHDTNLKNLDILIKNNLWSPEQFRYLLSRGFDVFGLIEKKIAIDKKLLQ